ncbi:uncharacterized protein LOC103282651, partial [Anolis carolinensis]|uniref:uncharacterized protein LOC103282651 n=1 Tax=Anolis carolinensis TaxID=28377 RepID=UPI002F2B7A30
MRDRLTELAAGTQNEEATVVVENDHYMEDFFQESHGFHGEIDGGRAAEEPHRRTGRRRREGRSREVSGRSPRHDQG